MHVISTSFITPGERRGGETGHVTRWKDMHILEQSQGLAKCRGRKRNVEKTG